jgi:hypothetical protein
MTDVRPANRPRILRLILIPSVITLAVTILRLVGELQRWPETWFNRGMGGSLVGITWLAPLFGIYFAVRLARTSAGPKSFLRAVGLSLLGVLLLFCGLFLPRLLGLHQGFYGRLIYAWLLLAVAALVTWPGWPELFKTLLAYGYCARLPVAIIMFCAIRGGWGTHYDAVPPDLPALGLVAKYLWIGFFPQLILWVAYTVLAGMLFGTLAAALMRLLRKAPQQAS